jgi:transcriptional regulator with XRE-family HTH domain
MEKDNKIRIHEMDKNLRQILALKNISLKSLSEEVGIPASTIHGWLNGVPPKNVHEIKKIADYFGLTVDALCFGRTDIPRLSDERVLAEIGNVELVLRIKNEGG